MPYAVTDIQSSDEGGRSKLVENECTITKASTCAHLDMLQAVEEMGTDDDPEERIVRLTLALSTLPYDKLELVASSHPAHHSVIDREFNFRLEGDHGHCSAGSGYEFGSKGCTCALPRHKRLSTPAEATNNLHHRILHMRLRAAMDAAVRSGDRIRVSYYLQADDTGVLNAY